MLEIMLGTHCLKRPPLEDVVCHVSGLCFTKCFLDWLKITKTISFLGSFLDSFSIYFLLYFSRFSNWFLVNFLSQIHHHDVLIPFDAKIFKKSLVLDSKNNQTNITYTNAWLKTKPLLRLPQVFSLTRFPLLSTKDPWWWCLQYQKEEGN